MNGPICNAATPWQRKDGAERARLQAVALARRADPDTRRDFDAVLWFSARLRAFRAQRERFHAYRSARAVA